MPIHTVIHGILLLCFALAPTIFWMRHFHPFVAVKEFVLTVSVLLSVGLLLIAVIFHGTKVIRKTRLSVAVLVYFLYNLFSLLVFPYTDKTSFFLFICLILLFFVVSSVTDRQQQHRLLHVLIIVAFGTSLYAIFQFFSKDLYRVFHLYFGKINIGPIEGSRPYSTFGHPNLLGGFCVFILPIIAVLLIRYFNQKHVVMGSYLTVAGILVLLALFLSRSRGAWIAMVLEVSCLVLAYGGRLLLPVVKKHLLLASILLTVCIGGAFGLFSVVKTYTSLTDMTSLGTRVEYYQNILSMIRERPLFGYGFNTFNVYYPTLPAVTIGKLTSWEK